MAIWQKLVDAHGFAAGYASVRRFVAKLRQRPAAQARVVITTAPGEEAQVDYGSGPMVRDPVSGKYRRTPLFVLTLGYSRKSVRLTEDVLAADIYDPTLNPLYRDRLLHHAPVLRCGPRRWRTNVQTLETQEAVR